jgi:hypothetical protein
MERNRRGDAHAQYTSVDPTRHDTTRHEESHSRYGNRDRNKKITSEAAYKRMGLMRRKDRRGNKHTSSNRIPCCSTPMGTKSGVISFPRLPTRRAATCMANAMGVGNIGPWGCTFLTYDTSGVMNTIREGGRFPTSQHIYILYWIFTAGWDSYRRIARRTLSETNREMLRRY